MAKFKWKTEDEQLVELKERKKVELKRECQEAIEAGFSYTKNDTSYHISYDREAQHNIQDVLRLFDNNMIDSYIMTVTKNDEHVRVKFSKEEFYNLHKESVLHRERKISVLRDCKFKEVDSLETKEKVENYSWDTPTISDPNEPELKDPKGLQDQIEGINETFNTFLPGGGDESNG